MHRPAMERSKQCSGKKDGPKTPASAPQRIDKSDARGRDAERGHLSRRKVLVAASVTAAIVVVGGLAFQFLTDWPRIALFGSARSLAAATFVGSETCAGCHQAEAERWRGSQHERAMQHATE